jgi:hypothetical protein
MLNAHIVSSPLVSAPPDLWRMAYESLANTLVVLKQICMYMSPALKGSPTASGRWLKGK